jgi:hypothetical protein
VIRHGTTAPFYTHQGYYRYFWYPPVPPGDWNPPTLWVDGQDALNGSGTISWLRTQYQNMISARLTVSSPVTMDLQVEYGAKDQTGTVHVQVVATEPITLTDLHLRIAVTESGLSDEGVDYDQVLRDYFPDRFGTAFSIALGDTFAHSQDFVIKTAWEAENCEIVAFVQDSTSYNVREVLQAAKSPVIVPAPDQVAGLTVTLAELDLALSWSPVATDTQGKPLAVEYYNVYRDTVSFFGPGSEPLASTTDTFWVDVGGVVGDTVTQYYYWVTAVAGYKESECSSLAGEFDRDLITGK